MRRPALFVSILLLASALLIRRRRRQAPPRVLSVTPAAAPLDPSATALAPAAAGMRFVSVPWELIAAPADEPYLTISYRSDVHMELDRIDAQETPTQLFVTVLMQRRATAGARFRAADEHQAVVPLSRPLGERELVHAPVDEPNDRPLYP